MKTWIFSLIIAALIGGCATIPPCPPRDIDVLLMMPFGPIKIPMKKGDLDRYIEQFEKYLQERGKSRI